MRYIQRASLLFTAVALVLALPGCAQASTEAGASPGGEAASGSTAADGGGGEKVATVGDEVITSAELHDYMKTANPKAIQEYFNARKQALENLINTRLMEAEAARQGISLEELQQKILSGTSPVTGEQVEKFYNDNKNRMGTNSLDAMRDRIRQFLENQQRQQAMGSFLQQQRAQHQVSVHLEPPRAEVAIAEHDPVKGPADAEVTLVEFSDFQ